MSKPKTRKLRAELAEWKDAAMTLLAVVHCDGGHYVQDHGLHQAVKDAETRIFRDRDNDGKRMAELAEAQAEAKRLDEQITQLANFIIDEVPGEPSRDEGAVDCAIRWMRSRLAEPEPEKEPCPKCGGTGCLDTPFSDSDPCCEECAGSGEVEA